MSLIEAALAEEAAATARRFDRERRELEEFAPRAEAELRRLLGDDLPPHEWKLLISGAVWLDTDIDGLRFLYKPRTFGGYELVWERSSDSALLSFTSLCDLGRLLRLAGLADKEQP